MEQAKACGPRGTTLLHAEAGRGADAAWTADFAINAHAAINGAATQRDVEVLIRIGRSRPFGAFDGANFTLRDTGTTCDLGDSGEDVDPGHQRCAGEMAGEYRQFRRKNRDSLSAIRHRDDVAHCRHRILRWSHQPFRFAWRAVAMAAKNASTGGGGDKNGTPWRSMNTWVVSATHSNSPVGPLIS